MRAWEIQRNFDKILNELRIINAKVSAMPQVQVQVSARATPTLIALQKLGGASTATEVSKVTGRSRTIESASLNILRSQGLVEKASVGHCKIFRLKPVEVNV